MESILEKICAELFQDCREYKSAGEFLKNEAGTENLLRCFKEYVTIDQRDAFDKLWTAVIKSYDEYGLAQFKGGFKTGFKLAFECLKG